MGPARTPWVRPVLHGSGPISSGLARTTAVRPVLYGSGPYQIVPKVARVGLNNRSEGYFRHSRRLPPQVRFELDPEVIFGGKKVILEGEKT